MERKWTVHKKKYFGKCTIFMENTREREMEAERGERERESD